MTVSADQADTPRGQPKTLDAAIKWLLDEVPRPVLAGVAALDKSELHSLHFGFAMHVRNAILWGNRELVHRMGLFDEDSASAVIVEALWERLRQDPAWESEIAWARKNHEVTQRYQAKSRAALPQPPRPLPRSPIRPVSSPQPPIQTREEQRFEAAAEYIVGCLQRGAAAGSGPDVQYYLSERMVEGEPMLRRRWLHLDRIPGESDEDALERARSDVEYQLEDSPDCYAAMVEVESERATVWVVDLVGDSGEHECLGPFGTEDEADAALDEEGLFDPDDLTLDDFSDAVGG